MLPYALLLLFVVSFVNCTGTLKCKGRRGLLEDPSRQETMSFCKMYSSRSCCNRTHTDQIILEVLPALKGQDFTSECSASTVQAACAPCDPEFAVHGELCMSFCQEWFDNCRRSYFSFNEALSKLVPCSSESLFCSPAELIAPSPREFCERAGHDIAKSEFSASCWEPRHNAQEAWSMDTSQSKTGSSSRTRRLDSHMRRRLFLVAKCLIAVIVVSTGAFLLWRYLRAKRRSSQKRQLSDRTERLLAARRDKQLRAAERRR